MLLTTFSLFCMSERTNFNSLTEIHVCADVQRCTLCSSRLEEKSPTDLAMWQSCCLLPVAVVSTHYKHLFLQWLFSVLLTMNIHFCDFRREWVFFYVKESVQRMLDSVLVFLCIDLLLRLQSVGGCGLSGLLTDDPLHANKMTLYSDIVWMKSLYISALS